MQKSKSLTAHDVFVKNNPIKAVMAEALINYCNSREKINDECRCIISKKYDEVCPIYKTIISTGHYIDQSEELTEVIGDCDFNHKFYTVEYITHAYNLLPKFVRIKSDKILKNLKK